MKQKILLLYTELGWQGSYLIQAPISLVYVSTHLAKLPDLEIELFDCRIEKDWQKKLQEKVLNENIILAGFFVMSGVQVTTAHEVTKFIKNQKPDLPIVWGGPHPTILPDDVLNYDGVDLCIRGFGTDAFTELVKKFLNNSTDYETIPNLCYKDNGKNVIGEINDAYERINYKELPYHLLDSFIEKYFEGRNVREFPIYTAFGCPYKCNFCISPIWFEDTNKKWDPLPAKEVVDHIEFLMNRYGINFIYFWDDDTFVSPRHFSGIAEEILDRNLKIKIGVRGIRSNEVERMSQKDIDLMRAVGIEYLHIGIESGSQKMLDIVEKGITVEQSLQANKKIAQLDDITPMYNMLCGIPTETLDDLKETGRFMLQISKDNPNCIIFEPNKLVPYPGGHAYELAIEHGYKPATSPESWGKLDKEGDAFQPWYTKESNQFIQMLQVASYGISNWPAYLKGHPFWLTALFKTANFVYKPIAKFRLKNGYSNFLIEHDLLNFSKKVLTKIKSI